MILWVVALRPEAAPLIAARELEAVGGDTPWPLYRRGDDEALVVTGVGRNAMAAACGWVLGHLAPPRWAGWINAGIAGHSQGPVGRALIAQRVVEQASARSWYPPPLPGLAGLAGRSGVASSETARATGDLQPVTLFTVDRPEIEFARPGAYDMEASAFLATVGRATTAELAQVVKVVSDCPQDPVAKLDRGQISRLIEGRLESLAAVAVALERRGATLAERSAAPPEYDRLLEGSHFTVTQRRQLRRLLERRAALLAGGQVEAPVARDGLRAADARTTLRRLSFEVETLARGGREAAG